MYKFHPRLWQSVIASLICLLLPVSAAAQPVEKIAGGFGFTEGPVWSRDGFLIFSDIPANRLHRFTPGAGISVLAEATGGTNGNAYDAEGRLYSCQSSARRVVRRERDGTITVLAERFEGRRLNAPNDLVVRRDGHLYFTDPAFGRSSNRRELDFFGVYHLAPDGRLEAVARRETRPNGIALSPDGRVLYVADSDAKSIRAYDLDAAGRASGERTVVTNIEGVPDGLRTDAAGMLWLAARQVVAFSPDGRKIAEIAVPETPANLAFGEADLRTLFVTARTGLYRLRVTAPGALSY